MSLTESSREKLRSKDWMEEAYWKRELSLRAIGKELQVSGPTVRYWLLKHALPLRDKSAALRGEKNPMFGKTHSPEARDKISIASVELMKNRKEEWSRRFSGERNPMYGKKHSPQTRKKMSETRQAFWASCDLEITNQTRKKMSDSARRKFAENPDLRKKMSDFASQRTGDKNPFFGHSHSETTRKKISEANQGRFVGECGSNWQGGKTSLHGRIRSSFQYFEWRTAVFKRDDYTCQECGQKGGALHVDHIVPFSHVVKKISSYQEAMKHDPLWDISNGRVLCVSCHRKTDTFAGRAQHYGS